MAWKSINDEKPKGTCLVHLSRPIASGRIQAADYSGNTPIIGGRFAFDMPEVTHWRPMVKGPGDNQ